MAAHAAVSSQSSIREELEKISSEARVFVSMPCVPGITPRFLLEKGHAEMIGAEEAVERRLGVFRIDEVGIPVLDHGVLYGDAAFEGILVVGKHLFQWREHLQRLYESAAKLCISIPYSPAELTAHVLETISYTGITDENPAYIRLVVTRGLGDLGINPAKCAGATIYAIVARIQLYPEALYEKGIQTSIARHVRRTSADVLDPAIKSCNYLNNILALLDTRDRSTNETLMLTREGAIAEATADNLFVVAREKGWESDPSKVTLTTPCDSYCLRGITREIVLHNARALGFQVVESHNIVPEDLFGAEREVFLTGTAAGLVPVISVDGKPVGGGIPGPITAKLRHLLMSDMANPEKGLWIFADRNEIEHYLNQKPGSWGRAERNPLITPDIVTTMFRYIDGRNWDELQHMFTLDIVYERPGYPPFEGLERLLKFYREERVIASGQHLLESVVVNQHEGACWGRFVGVHKNNSPIDERFADVYTFKDGKIQTRRSYFFRPAV